MEVHGWTVEVGKKKVKIYDPNDEIADEEAISIIRYLFDEGILSDMRIECIIVTK